MKFLFCLFLLSGFLFSNWVARIDDYSIYTSSFQDFVDIQKSSANLNLANRGKSVLQQLLQKYIDDKIVLIKAKKKGFNLRNSEIRELYNSKKEEWVQQFFLLQEIDISGIQITENDLRLYYGLLQKKEKSYQKPLEKLNAQELNVVRQLVMSEKQSKKLDIYRKSQESSYKVKYNSIQNPIVATFGGQPIERKTVERKLDEQLIILNQNPAKIKKTPEVYNQYKEKVLQEIILKMIVDANIKKENFTDNRLVKVGLNLLKDQIIIQYFLQKEIFEKINITEKEKETLYNSKKKEIEAQIESQNLGWVEVNKVLENNIRQRKGVLKLQQLVNDSKEESVIKKNYEELDKIRF